MRGKCFTAEQIIGVMREAYVELSRGKNAGQICRDLGISEQTYYRWRKKNSGMKVTQAKRLKGLEKENACLKRAVVGLTLNKLILNEPLGGNYYAPPGVGSALDACGASWASRSFVPVV